jgi:2'-5' RNA ligase
VVTTPSPERSAPRVAHAATRAFIALNLPDADRQALHAAAQPVRDAVDSGAWVAAANLHLTLKFLGQVEPGPLASVEQRLREIAARHRPLTLDIGGAGVFPNLRAPRIVWMGVGQDARLELLYHDVERACDVLGFPVEGRAFRPHLTLGRLKAPPDATARGRLTEAVRALTESRRVVVRTVDLMASRPGAGGSRYTVMNAAPLGEER